MPDTTSGLPSHTATQTLSTCSLLSTITTTLSTITTTLSTITTMLPKRVARLTLVTCLLVTIAIVYVTLFKHPPPDQLLKMNSGHGKSFSMRAFGHLGDPHVYRARELTENQDEAADDQDGAKSEEEEEEKEGNFFDKFEEEEVGVQRVKPEGVRKDEDTALSTFSNHKPKASQYITNQHRAKDSQHKAISNQHRAKSSQHRAKSSEQSAKSSEHRAKSARDNHQDKGGIKGKAAWDKFIADNHHTVIGIVFDACENPSEQLGTVVLLPDTKNGGVMSRTFYNFTVDRVIDEGWTFNVDVKYNGQDLYDNWWEVCEMEEDLESGERTFLCPVHPGPLSLVKDKHIPAYIPKGRYLTKAWVKDSNNTVLLCGFSDFVL